ncbi:MAG: ferredoxin [Thermoprotei archaeon]|nr:MAG: ferredoxin [Thermoprotei archaeon]HDI31440.1 4Fe-4S dicluster domain-containing protein [Thermofilum sp.]
MSSIHVPVSKPKVGSLGKTGVWRSLRPVINYSKCTNCKLCWLYCPEASILIEDERVTIDYEYCKGCGVCINVCPVKAISMVREEF